MENNENRNRQRRERNTEGWFEIVDKNPNVSDRKIRIVDENNNDYIPTAQNTPNDRIRIVDPDQIDQINQAKVRHAKKPSLIIRSIPIYVIVISLVGLAIILFAFFMESRNTGREETPVVRRLVTEVQTQLNTLDWVSQDFIPVNRFSRPGDKLEEVNAIVIHNIGNPGTTALQNRNYFANLAETEERQASSNFIICLDGSIIQCVPVDEVAYASNDRNHDTLSIEICHPDDSGKFTDESYSAAIRLTAWLCVRFGLSSEDILRHHDIRPTGCPRYFVENEEAWETFKADVQRMIER